MAIYEDPNTDRCAQVLTEDVRHKIHNAITDGWEPPLSYDAYSTDITDSRGKIVISIRGWGHLHHLGGDKAMRIQDDLGEGLTTLLNNLLYD